MILLIGPLIRHIRDCNLMWYTVAYAHKLTCLIHFLLSLLLEMGLTLNTPSLLTSRFAAINAGALM